MTGSRSIGLASAVAVVIGNMIGTSIYVSLGFQVVGLPSGFSILMVWTLGAFIAMLGALCYAELAGALPKSGGEYHFLNVAYPPTVSFLSGWISLIAGFPAPVAIGALALGQYLMHSLTGLPTSGADMMVRGIAIGSIVIITAFHCLTLRTASRFHGLFTLLKISLILVLIVGAFTLAPSPQPVEWLPSARDFDPRVAQPFFTSLYFALYAYAGWNSACYIASEVREPSKNVPRALLLGIGIVFLLYVLLMAGFLYATPVMDLATSKGEAALVAAKAIFGENGARIVGISISIGLVSFISSMTWAGPRVGQRMGQDYDLLAPLSKTNAHGIPINSILLQSFVAIGFILLVPDLEKLTLYVELLLQVSLFLTVLSVIILRVKRPDLPRPVRCWGYPVTPILFLCWIAVAMSAFLQSNHNEAIGGLGTLVAGLLVRMLCKYKPSETA